MSEWSARSTGCHQMSGTGRWQPEPQSAGWWWRRISRPPVGARSRSITSTWDSDITLRTGRTSSSIACCHGCSKPSRLGATGVTCSAGRSDALPPPHSAPGADRPDGRANRPSLRLPGRARLQRADTARTGRQASPGTASATTHPERPLSPVVRRTRRFEHGDGPARRTVGDPAPLVVVAGFVLAGHRRLVGEPRRAVAVAGCELAWTTSTSTSRTSSMRVTHSDAVGVFVDGHVGAHPRGGEVGVTDVELWVEQVDGRPIRRFRPSAPGRRAGA